MSGPVVVIVLLVLAGLFAVWLVMRASRERAHDEDRLASPATETLDYAVPLGQDPAVVMAALQGQGITAVVEPGPKHQIVHIEAPTDTQRPREKVREIISSADSTAIDHGAPVDVRRVRFMDE